MQKAVLTIVTEMCVIKTSLTGYMIVLVGPNGCSLCGPVPSSDLLRATADRHTEGGI